MSADRTTLGARRVCAACWDGGEPLIEKRLPFGGSFRLHCCASDRASVK